MSQRAQRRVLKTAAMTAQPVMEGNAARASRPEPVPVSDLPVANSRARVTLSLVPKMNERNKRSVVVMFIALVLLAFAVIVTLVLMNTSVAQRQYDLVSLRNQERVLSQENQALVKEAQSLAAPQALAKKAKELGLVAPAAPGLMDLTEGKITQDAEAAVKTDDSSANYATLPLPGDSIRPKTKAKATKTTKAATPEPTVGKSTAATTDTSANATTDAAKTEAKSEKPTREIANDGRPVFTDGELNGGTIPAPTIKSPTN